MRSRTIARRAIPPVPAESIRRNATGAAYNNAYMTTASTVGNGVVSVAPLWIEETCTVDALRGEVTSATAGAGTITLLVYDSDPQTLLPNRLRASGDMDANTVAVSTITLAAPVVLTPGLYWAGHVLQNAASPATVRCVSTTHPHTSNVIPYLGTPSMGVTHRTVCNKTSWPVGPPPDPYGSVNTIGASSVACIVHLRLA